jgi:hypothetical protein
VTVIIGILCEDGVVIGSDSSATYGQNPLVKRLTENELSDFSQLWHDGCVEAIIEAQDVDRNHSA